MVVSTQAIYMWHNLDEFLYVAKWPASYCDLIVNPFLASTILISPCVFLMGSSYMHHMSIVRSQCIAKIKTSSVEFPIATLIETRGKGKFHCHQHSPTVYISTYWCLLCKKLSQCNHQILKKGVGCSSPCVLGTGGKREIDIRCKARSREAAGAEGSC